MLGVGLPTPPQVLTVGLLRDVWLGQATSHSVAPPKMLTSVWLGQETSHSALLTSMLGVGLPTPPQVLTVGLLRGW
jgi:hypothetical protein